MISVHPLSPCTARGILFGIAIDEADAVQNAVESSERSSTAACPYARGLRKLPPCGASPCSRCTCVRKVLLCRPCHPTLDHRSSHRSILETFTPATRGPHAEMPMYHGRPPSLMALRVGFGFHPRYKRPPSGHKNPSQLFINSVLCLVAYVSLLSGRDHPAAWSPAPHLHRVCIARFNIRRVCASLSDVT